MPINRPNVYSAGAATNTDLFIDASTNKLGEAARVISFHGQNPDQDQFPEYVTNNGLMRSPTASTYYDGINSTFAADSSTGIGAQKVYIEGIDDEGDLASEVVTMNGTSIVGFTNDYYCINKCVVVEAGSLGTNQGTLSLRSGVNQLQNGEGFGGAITNLGMAGYPRGFTPMLHNVRVSASRDSAATSGGDIRLELYHVQNIADDVVYNKIREWKFALDASFYGSVTQYNDVLIPPHIVTGSIQGTDFTNVPTAGYFYFRSQGDAALSAIVNCSADLLYRDARS